MPQYGEVRVDFITYTTGVAPNEGNVTVPISGLINSPTFSGDVIIEGDLEVNGDLTVSGDINASGVTISGFTGLFASGTAASPSISFVGDENTGIYSPAADQLALSTNGTGRLFVDGTGLTKAVGTANTVLDVENSGNTYQRIGFYGTGTSLKGRVGTSTSNANILIEADPSNLAASSSVQFSVDGSERLRITSDGNLGVGTSSPLNKFHLADTAAALRLESTSAPTDEKTIVVTQGADGSFGLQGLNSSGAGGGALVKINRSGNNLQNITTTRAGTDRIKVDFWNSKISFSNALGTIGTTDGNDLAFETNATERLRITSAGLVGIGTSSPTSKLYVSGPISAPSLTFNTDEILTLRGGTVSGSFGVDNSSPFGFYIQAKINTPDSRPLLLNPAGGNVGIGTSSPGHELDVAGVIRNNKVVSSATGDYTRVNAALISRGKGGRAVLLGVNNSNVPYVQAGSADADIGVSNLLLNPNGGNVGIGTSSPGAQLDVRTGANNTAIEEIAAFARPDAAVRATINKGLSTGNGISFGTTTGQPIAFRTDDTERLYIDSSGRVGIGTTSPGAKLHIAQEYATPSTQDLLRLQSTSGIDSAVMRIGGYAYTGNARSAIDFVQNANSNFQSQIVFSTSAGADALERARIDSSGRLLIATSASRNIGAYPSILQLEGSQNYTNSSISLTHNRPDGGGPEFRFAKSRGTSAGSNTLVASGDALGTIFFYGADGTDAQSQAGRISCEVDGTPGANDMPGRLVFSTTADGASSPTERMRITSTGAVLIGTQTPVNSSTGSDDGFTAYASGSLHISRADNESLFLRRRSSDGNVVNFYRVTSLVGSISVTTTSTAYNTSSDYRLKENVTPVTDGITRLQQLKPSRFNFIADPAKTVDGFLAHEVQTIVPEAITGEKDAVDDEGNPQYQGIDQSKIVPLVVAALQEAIAKIETLEQRLNDAGIN